MAASSSCPETLLLMLKLINTILVLLQVVLVPVLTVCTVNISLICAQFKHSEKKIRNTSFFLLSTSIQFIYMCKFA